MGWKIVHDEMFDRMCWFRPETDQRYWNAPNLYLAPNAELAWIAFNWFHRLWWPNTVGQPDDRWTEFDNKWKGIVGWGFELEELQREMLDKLVEMIGG